MSAQPPFLIPPLTVMPGNLVVLSPGNVGTVFTSHPSPGGFILAG